MDLCVTFSRVAIFCIASRREDTCGHFRQCHRPAFSYVSPRMVLQYSGTGVLHCTLSSTLASSMKLKLNMLLMGFWILVRCMRNTHRHQVNTYTVVQVAGIHVLQSTSTLNPVLQSSTTIPRIICSARSTVFGVLYQGVLVPLLPVETYYQSTLWTGVHCTVLQYDVAHLVPNDSDKSCST